MKNGLTTSLPFLWKFQKFGPVGQSVVNRENKGDGLTACKESSVW